MSLKDDLQADVDKIFTTRWTERDGQVVPDDDSVSLGNDAVKVDATVLYADLADSTALVDVFKPFFAAEIYKPFLACAARIIRNEGGVITAYDGDRIMAVYIGGSKNTSAVRTSLKINWAVRNVIRPTMSAQYPSTHGGQLEHEKGAPAESSEALDRPNWGQELGSESKSGTLALTWMRRHQSSAVRAADRPVALWPR